MPKLKNKFILALVLILLSCTTIARVPELPNISGAEDELSLVQDEATLFSYANTLYAWLIITKAQINKRFKDHTFPSFEKLENLYVRGSGIEAVKLRISYYARYIAQHKAIADKVYEKYGRIKDLRIK